MDETPDYSDSDTNPNTTASSVLGDTVDGRKKRSEANQLRRSIFGKKHDRLGESKVRAPTSITWLEPWVSLNNDDLTCLNFRKMTPFDDFATCLA